MQSKQGCSRDNKEGMCRAAAAAPLQNVRCAAADSGKTGHGQSGERVRPHRRMRRSQSGSWYFLHPTVMLVQA